LGGVAHYCSIRWGHSPHDEATEYLHAL
jgi:hypothetical protein